MTLDGLRALAGDAPRHVFLIRIANGFDAAATARELASTFPSTFAADPGPRVHNLDDVRSAPLLVAAAIALLALATLVHAQLTSARRRRHDIALLRTFGMRPGQVDRMLVWQGLTMMSVAVLVGVPLGAVAGRQVWSFVARSLGVGDDPAPLPIAAIGGILVGALVIASVLAAITVPAARRIKPAVALRAE
jgi:ABC-type lipoprotein release transport system permease subunit